MGDKKYNNMKNLRRVVAGALFALTVAGCAGPSAEARISRGIIREVNKVREIHQLEPLAEDRNLDRIAAEHADDMSKHNYCGHGDSKGRTVGERLRNIGALAVGENVGYCAVCNNEWTVDQTCSMFEQRVDLNDVIRTIVNQWLSSAPHRRNILGEYDFTGVAVSIIFDTTYTVRTLPGEHSVEKTEGNLDGANRCYKIFIVQEFADYYLPKILFSKP